ncbi:16S rRNA (uracil1498-N3)-methyltransferase [Pseudochelatococcus lubricantis]|uniref:Ribosomal RNA small subunit methyltransferase E n=1 Tax=Pseudochelatococcus lubricantis TaxID=1538102 RepID=A0ABX0UX97_9HYPH|nr:16S rRNA (uracil(1498)-N(3))-methyltransferase [Pseudochelatococcus lubricantis]NIJ56510.1 16S rRNA (uracil1498-N3)-methyltransferase [Pseudochelatococcus lubricantis]
MSDYDFSAPRLFVQAAIAAGEAIALDKAQANYLGNVLRLSSGDGVLIFNGRDGEWLARVEQGGRRVAGLMPEKQTRPQPPGSDLLCLFAPLKHARLDYMVQKAVEMGASVLAPVLTRRTQVSRVNLERMEANAVEAAEQCGILAIPAVREPARLDDALARLEPGRLLVFCDEGAPVANAVAALAQAREEGAHAGIAVLIGPEGGFDEAERDLILARPDTVRLSLGPRILRADTAAVAALAVVQAVLGDWCGNEAASG